MPNLDLLSIPVTEDLNTLRSYLDQNFKRIADLLKIPFSASDLASDSVTADEIAAGAVGLSELDDTIETFLCPTGAVLPFADDVIPTGWLLCDGQAVSRTTYAALFALIGTVYGVGDGSTTFNIPNLKGRVPVGRDSGDTDWDTLGEIRGAKTHTLASGEMPAHLHTTGDNAGHFVYGGGATAVGPASGNGFRTALTAISTQSTGGGGAHNNLQPSIVLNYIIKT